ncbi:hypothetical protein KKHLCK_00675 [Candidatus Electrothrix laxa]
MDGINKTYKALRTWYLRLCAIPPVAFAGMVLWAKSQPQQGWGGWAVGAGLSSVMPSIIASSAVMALLGAALVLWAKYLGERLTYLLLGTMLSGSVAGLVLVYLTFR